MDRLVCLNIVPAFPLGSVGNPDGRSVGEERSLAGRTGRLALREPSGALRSPDMARVISITMTVRVGNAVSTTPIPSLSPADVVTRIESLNAQLAGFWSKSDGWAPADAAGILGKSRLDWQVSLSGTLRTWVGRPVLTPGELILAWANLGALIEGSVKPRSPSRTLRRRRFCRGVSDAVGSLPFGIASSRATRMQPMPRLVGCVAHFHPRRGRRGENR